MNVGGGGAVVRIYLDQCKVTGRKHRVSPCRSAYFASPCPLLTLDLKRRSREAALLFARVVMASDDVGSRFSFHDNPEYKTPS